MPHGSHNNQGKRGLSAVSRNSGSKSKNGSGKFVPLRDLLRRNHDDRVQDYLAKMDQENQEDLLNTKTDMGAKKPKDVTPA